MTLSQPSVKVDISLSECWLICLVNPAVVVQHPFAVLSDVGHIMPRMDGFPKVDDNSVQFVLLMKLTTARIL